MSCPKYYLILLTLIHIQARDTSKHHSKFQPIKSYPQHSRDLHVQHVTSTIQTNKNPAIQTRDAYVKARDIYATPHKQKQGHRGGWENSVTAQVHVDADMEAQNNPVKKRQQEFNITENSHQWNKNLCPLCTCIFVYLTV